MQPNLFASDFDLLQTLAAMLFRASQLVVSVDRISSTLQAAHDCIGALLGARHELDRHYRACDEAHDGEYNDLGVEARKRLDQMIWLLSEVKRRHEIAFEAQRPQFEIGALLHAGEITQDEWAERVSLWAQTNAARLVSDSQEALETLTEAFYWIAFRARNAIRGLPGLAGFEAEGVRNTRNKLLEHPDKQDSGVLITSFAWGAECGPVIKAVRYGHQTDVWVDQGLFVNAQQFAAELKRRAERRAMR